MNLAEKVYRNTFSGILVPLQANILIHPCFFNPGKSRGHLRPIRLRTSCMNLRRQSSESLQMPSLSLRNNTYMKEIGGVKQKESLNGKFLFKEPDGLNQKLEQ